MSDTLGLGSGAPVGNLGRVLVLGRGAVSLTPADEGPRIAVSVVPGVVGFAGRGAVSDTPAPDPPAGGLVGSPGAGTFVPAGATSVPPLAGFVGCCDDPPKPQFGLGVGCVAPGVVGVEPAEECCVGEGVTVAGGAWGGASVFVSRAGGGAILLPGGWLVAGAVSLPVGAPATRGPVAGAAAFVSDVVFETAPGR